jgi:hypothetical protein
MATLSNLLAGQTWLRAGLHTGLCATSRGPTWLGTDMLLVAGLRQNGATSIGLVTDVVPLFNKRVEARTGDTAGVLVSARARMSAVKSTSPLTSSAESDVLSACVLPVDSKDWRFVTGMLLLLVLLMFDYRRLTS